MRTKTKPKRCKQLGRQRNQANSKKRKKKKQCQLTITEKAEEKTR